MQKGPRGDITFQCNNKEYTIIPTYLALAEIEKRVEKNIIQIAEQLNNNQLNISNMIIILWCGLNLIDQKEDLNSFGENIIKLGINKIHDLVTMFVIEYFEHAKNN